MEGKRKRKVDFERRQFKKEWGVKYFFAQAGVKAFCLICHDSVAVLKEYNVRRHYEAKHGRSHSQFTGAQRVGKLKSLQRSRPSQQAAVPQESVDEASITRAIDKVKALAKRGKSFTDGELIQECTMKAVSELCPEKANLFHSTFLALNTVARRMEDIGSNTVHRIAEKARNFPVFSLALDESAVGCDTSQLLVFIRVVDSEFNVTQELALRHSMHGAVTGENIFKELQKTVLEYNLEWNTLQCVTVDGGKNMSQVTKGLVGQITETFELGGFSKPMFLHCLLHQQALCRKYVDMSCVLNPVVSAMNFILSHGFNHCQFREFLKETDAEFVDLSYTAIRWLSCGKILSRFFQLRKEINSFLTEKNQPEPLLSNTDWLWKLAFFADLAGHMNRLHLNLQVEANLISDLFTHVKAFRAKLTLFERQMEVPNLVHFPCCKKFHEENEAGFPSSFATEIIKDLQKQFHDRFSDLDEKADEIKLFQNPFGCKVETLPRQFKLEIIALQSNGMLKDKYKEGNLIQFYKSLPSEQFPNLKRFACGFVSVFGATYLCEQTFSERKPIKIEHISD